MTAFKISVIFKIASCGIYSAIKLKLLILIAETNIIVNAVLYFPVHCTLHFTKPFRLNADKAIIIAVMPDKFDKIISLKPDKCGVIVGMKTY